VGMAVADFFLAIDDIQSEVTWTPPYRTNVDVVPLIDGKQTFEEFHKAISGAKESVFFAAWVFATDMGGFRQEWEPPDRRGPAPFGRWHNVFVNAAKRGVEVKILLTDFDPTYPHHPDSWQQYEHFFRRRREIKPPGSLHVMCSRHPAVTDKLLQLPFFNGHMKKKTQQAIDRINGHQFARVRRRLRLYPGLWRIVTLDRQARLVKLVSSPDYIAWPVTHHQKLLIVDGRLGFCGGLDVTNWRNDSSTRFHHWHDIHLKLRGDVVYDLERTFTERWNRERVLFNAFLAEARAAKPAGVPFNAVDAPPVVWKPKPLGNVGTSTAQVHRTVSEDSMTWIPNTVVDQIWRGYEAAINQAQQYVYIENQYVRSADLVELLTDRAGDVPDLKILMVIPTAPEEEPDAPTKHGIYLQHENLEELTTELGSRFGVYSLLQRGGFSGAPGFGALHNSRQVYVHSKCMIIDDVYATVGSANATDRSFEIDTECNVAFHDPAKVKAFRVRLWRELLGVDTSGWPLGEVVTRWNQIATANVGRKPAARSGYVVPHPYANYPGEASSLIPDVYAEVDQQEAPPAGLLA
jgi:phosphatidylserine/phosphatidylglycerophosphate/cardiolipin synthase-like enzyme